MPRDTISEAKLSRMVSDISWASSGYSKNEGRDVPAYFGYDHGNMLVTDKAGTRDLLFEHRGESLRSNACRLLQHFSPDVASELIRGYRLARAAGLLDDGKINPEVADWLSPLSVGFSPSERRKAGAKVADVIRDTLRKENHKPGGIPIVDAIKTWG